MTYQSYHGSNTEELNILLSKAKPNYSLRNSLNIEVPRPRSEIGRSSFKHRAALAWNFLLHHVKDCANLRSSKIGLNANKHLLNSINFARGSCCVSMKNDDFLYFYLFIIYNDCIKIYLITIVFKRKFLSCSLKFLY